jgi:exosortase
VSVNSSPQTNTAARASLGNLGRFLLPVVVILLLSALYVPTLKLLGNVWWTDENYSHGLVVPAIAAFILWMQRRKLAQTEKRPALWLGTALIIIALLMLYLGVVGPIYLLQYLSLVMMLIGITIYWGGGALLRPLAVPFVLFALAIPLPTVIMNNIAAPLQLLASQCAVWLMQLFHIPLVREGNIIEMLPRGALQTEKLEIVRACSGVRSLFSLLFMAVMLAYFTHPRRRARAAQGTAPVWWRRYGFWRSLLLCAAAVPIAVLTNALRVGGTGVLSYYYGLEYATGFFHTFAGAITYGSAAALLLCAAWLMDCTYKRHAQRRAQLG